MNRESLGSIAAATFLLATACSHIEQHLNANSANNSSAASPSKPDEFAAARTIFMKDCKGCHGDTGIGGPVKLEDGTKLKVPSLREGHALRHPDSDFVKQITKGGDGMPAFKDKLTAQQIDDLVHFIRHEFQGGATPLTEPAKK